MDTICSIALKPTTKPCCLKARVVGDCWILTTRWQGCIREALLPTNWVHHIEAADYPDPQGLLLVFLNEDIPPSATLEWVSID